MSKPWSERAGKKGMSAGNEAMEYERSLRPPGVYGQPGSREWFESNERHARNELIAIAKAWAWYRLKV